MLVINITTGADTSCVFTFGGRDVGRGSSLSIPVGLLRSREAAQNRPWLMESVGVELLESSPSSSSLSGLAGGKTRLAELRLPLSDLSPETLRSEGRYYKVRLMIYTHTHTHRCLYT